MEPKAPTGKENKEKVTQAEIKINLTNLPKEYEQPMKTFFDFAATLSGDIHPKSTSPDGTGRFRTLGSGKTIPERGATLQDSKYLELFRLFSNTYFFSYLCKEYFGKSNLDEEKVKQVFELCIQNNEVEVKKLLTKEEAFNFLDTLINMQKELQGELSPEFVNLKEGETITRSDLIVNMLFIRTTAVLNFV